MSPLVEIEQAIDRLPDWDVDQLVGWLETRRAKKSTRTEMPSDPDFLESQKGRSHTFTYLSQKTRKRWLDTLDVNSRHVCKGHLERWKGLDIAHKNGKLENMKATLDIPDAGNRGRN
jgi:hypothetical protein